MKIAHQNSNLTLLAVVLSVALARSSPAAGESKIRINDRFPLKSAGELSPPTVEWPIHECAKVVFVFGFIPGATIHVFSGGNQLIGQENNTLFGFTPIHLNRELNVGEKITATQTALGLTSAQSYYPVRVEPYDPSGLTKPVVSRDIYDCGQVVPVNNLVPSAWVKVFDTGANIGTDETTGTGDAVVTSPLKKGHPITAQQTACPDQPTHKLTGPMSAAVRVKPSPNPPPWPSVDPVVVGNNAVALHGLFVGAQVEVRNAGTVIGGGLATASDNWCPVNPPIPSNPSVQSKQTLCTPSSLSPPQTKTVPINQLIILPPVCDHSQQVTIRGTQVNATVVLLRGGSQIVGYGGAVPGDLVLQVGGAAHLNAGDVLTAVQYMGNNSSTPSQPVTVGACADVVTYHNDNSRTGLNPSEKLLTPASVNPKNFGKLFSHQVDGYVYAEPLYLSQVPIPGKGTHNVVFVATEHDSVYAFDADSNAGAIADPLWHTSFIDKNAGITSVVPSPCGDILVEIGITGTPVIDRRAGILYVVAKTLENRNGHGHYVQRLHALDVTTGIERPGGPKLIGETICDDPGSCGQGQYVSGPTVPGSGEDNDGIGHVLFNAL